MKSDMLESSGRCRWRVLFLVLSFEGGLLLLAFLLNLLMDNSLAGMFRWTLPHLAAGIAATLPLAVLFVLIVRSEFAPLRRIRQTLDSLLPALFKESKSPDLLLISLMAGAGEEALFRGVIQTWAMGLMRDWFGPQGPGWCMWGGSGGPGPLDSSADWAGLLLASVLFGLVHFITPAYAVIAGAAGLYLGLLYLWTGNLLVPILAHGVYDYFALVYLLSRFNALKNGHQ